MSYIPREALCASVRTARGNPPRNSCPNGTGRRFRMQFWQDLMIFAGIYALVFTVIWRRLQRRKHSGFS